MKGKKEGRLSRKRVEELGRGKGEGVVGGQARSCSTKCKS
jgi:hypothetical protein